MLIGCTHYSKRNPRNRRVFFQGSTDKDVGSTTLMNQAHTRTASIFKCYELFSRLPINYLTSTRFEIEIIRSSFVETNLT